MTEVEQYLHRQHAEQALKRLPKFEQQTDAKIEQLTRVVTKLYRLLAITCGLLIAVLLGGVLCLLSQL